MTVWRDDVTGALRDTVVDMTLSLGQRWRVAHSCHSNNRFVSRDGFNRTVKLPTKNRSEWAHRWAHFRATPLQTVCFS
jgi:hypothetical protein